MGFAADAVEELERPVDRLGSRCAKGSLAGGARRAGEWRRADHGRRAACSKARARGCSPRSMPRTARSSWSTDTQTGVIAAPVSYAVDGEQYVAVVVGTGGSWAATFASAANLKGNDLPNVSRVLAYKLRGRTVPPPAARPVRVLAPPPASASQETVERGFGPFMTYCARCHGVGAVNDGILPDLRYSPMLDGGRLGRRVRTVHSRPTA